MVPAFDQPARKEARSYLENARSLTFLKDQPPKVLPARFARTPGDFLVELQEAIFKSRSEQCLSREELHSLYGSVRRGSIARKHLSQSEGQGTVLAHVGSVCDLGGVLCDSCILWIRLSEPKQNDPRINTKHTKHRREQTIGYGPATGSVATNPTLRFVIWLYAFPTI